MAFDEGLAQRLRDVLLDEAGITERRMFGGIAFMDQGHMVVGVIGDTLMARVGPARHDEAMARPHARPMEFTGRSMVGFATVDPPGFEDDADLRWWIDVSRDHAASLPPKEAKEPKAPKAATAPRARRPRAT